ncbi:hypothetical protein J6590_022502 [Homalodisca vitripennis]|nr:hypothetical protein J6590_022502 [Homalodisca vitripennis]
MFWGFCCQQDFNRFFTLQRRVLTIAWSLGREDSCRERFRSDGVLTVTSLLIYHTLILMVFRQQYIFPTLKHNYNTRNKCDLSTYKYSDQFPDIKHIKTRRRRHLIRIAYYSLEDAVHTRQQRGVHRCWRRRTSSAEFTGVGVDAPAARSSPVLASTRRGAATRAYSHLAKVCRLQTEMYNFRVSEDRAKNKILEAKLTINDKNSVLFHPQKITQLQKIKHQQWATFVVKTCKQDIHNISIPVFEKHRFVKRPTNLSEELTMLELDQWPTDKIIQRSTRRHRVPVVDSLRVRPYLTANCNQLILTNSMAMSSCYRAELCRTLQTDSADTSDVTEYSDAHSSDTSKGVTCP